MKYILFIIIICETIYIAVQHDKINGLKQKAVYYDYIENNRQTWEEQNSKYMDSLYKEIDSLAEITKIK